ncbi:MAG TPA: EboA domain-containing protein [Polyangiales bacterium]
MSMAQAALTSALLRVVSKHAPPDTAKWFAGGVPRAGVSQPRSLFFGYFAGIGRRLRGASFELGGSELGSLRALGLPAPERWSLADLARAALLLAACAQLPSGEHVPLAKELYEKGDNAERVAVLRTLHLLPEPQRFRPVAEDACRVHVLDVFTAIACDNPYPAQCFSEASYNQMVVKALFLEVPLARVLGVAERKNQELYRMARDYEAERRAAGRVVTRDTNFVAHELEKTA